MYRQTIGGGRSTASNDTDHPDALKSSSRAVKMVTPVMAEAEVHDFSESREDSVGRRYAKGNAVHSCVNQGHTPFRLRGHPYD